MKYRNSGKKKLIGSNMVLIIVFILFIPGVMNGLRYNFEKALGVSYAYIYPLGVGIKDLDSKSNLYMDEVSLEYDLEFNWQHGQYLHIRKNDYSENIDIYIFGKVYNSNEPLIITLNGNVIYNKKPGSSGMSKFWEDFYLDRAFAVKIEPLQKNKLNRIVFICGDSSEEVNIYYE